MSVPECRDDTTYFCKLPIGKALNVNFRNIKAILNMQRHWRNFKVLELLVGLGPYQAYTKRYAWLNEGLKAVVF